MAWLNGWAKRVKLTIDHDDIDAALENFPILLYISDSSGHGSKDISCVFDELTSDDNRKKIAVTLTDGETECYVEIEKWDDGNEKAWLWVKVSGEDSIASDADTDLYLYYDSSHADNDAYVGDTNDEVAESVWDANFKGIYHMGGALDSTSNDNDLTDATTADAEGKVARCRYFDGADKMHVTTADYDLPTEFTLEFLFKTDGAQNQYATLLDKGEAANTDRNFWLAGDADEYLWLKGASGIANLISIKGAVDIFDDAWHYGVARYKSGGANQTSVWVDDGTDHNEETQTGELTGQGDAFWIGAPEGYESREFKGWIDEVRLSNVHRADAWIKATYETSRDHLLDFGSEETAEQELTAASVSVTSSVATATISGTGIAPLTGIAVSVAVSVVNASLAVVGTINTAAKRRMAAGIVPFHSVLIPDGTIDHHDRMQIACLYSANVGILQELTASPVTITSSVQTATIAGSGNAPLTGVAVSVASSVKLLYL